MFARLTSDDLKAGLQARVFRPLQRGRAFAKGLVAFSRRGAIDWARKSVRRAALIWAESSRKTRNWWPEGLAAVAPLAILAVFVRGPEIPSVLRSEASIGTVAAVQGAVTGLSLIALVLTVELARRQEDRDDTAYEIMLRSAWIRPTFAFALAALLATLGAAAIADFSAVAQGSRAANILLCTYVLTGSVVIGLLATVLRTVHVLRPTGVIDYRYRANDQERRRRVAEFISKSLNEFPTLGPIERLLLPHTPVRLTATERLFAEVDDALQSGQAARFSGALQRLRDLIERSADQIAASTLGFQPPGRPPLGYWFPLDALEGRLGELWRSALARQGYEFEREMWSLEFWLVKKAVERRSGELMEVGLRCGLISYQVAREVGRSNDHVRHEWMNLKGAAWWQLRESDGREFDRRAEPFVMRLIEYMQEYGNMLLKRDDADSFLDLLSEFRESFYDSAERRHLYRMYTDDQNAPLSIFEYAVMALLALAGRAITLKERGELKEVDVYVNPIIAMVGDVSPIERFVPTAYEPETPLHQQWGWWEPVGEDGGGVRFAWVAPEQYPMMTLLVILLRSGSDKPLPSLGGCAQRFIEAWAPHKDVIMEAADIEAEARDETALRFERRLETGKAAEDREREDFHLAAPLDQARVAQFLSGMRSERQSDRVLESCFARAGRVRQLDESQWGDQGRFAHAWRLPRSPFVDDPSFLPLEPTDLVKGFERGLASQLAERVTDTSQVQASVAMELDDILTAVDAAFTAIGEGQQLILFVGVWQGDVLANLRLRMYTDSGSYLSPSQARSPLALGTYKGGQILRVQSQGKPRVVVLALDRWGWLTRAPKDGEDFRVSLAEINLEEAMQLASAELPEDADEETRAEKVRELRLRVRLQAEERSRFEVENPDAARIIRVASAVDETQGEP